MVIVLLDDTRSSSVQSRAHLFELLLAIYLLYLFAFTFPVSARRARGYAALVGPRVVCGRVCKLP